MARSTARKRALNTLYEADEKGQDILSLLEERIAVPGAQTPLPEYAIEIVRGVAEHRRDIDEKLDECSTGWKISRMGVVDRNILRIAAWMRLSALRRHCATANRPLSFTDCCPLYARLTRSRWIDIC